MEPIRAFEGNCIVPTWKKKGLIVLFCITMSLRFSVRSLLFLCFYFSPKSKIVNSTTCIGRHVRMPLHSSALCCFINANGKQTQQIGCWDLKKEKKRGKWEKWHTEWKWQKKRKTNVHGIACGESFTGISYETSSMICCCCCWEF